MKQMMIKKRLLTLLLALTLICGCGAQEDKPADSAGDDQFSVSGTASPSGPEPSYDLMQEKWAQERTDTEAFWNVASCLEIALPNPSDADFSSYYSAVEGSCYYVLTAQISIQTPPDTQLPEQTGCALFLTRTDVDSGESVMEKLELRPTSDGASAENTEVFLQAFQNNQAALAGMDVSGGRIYLFFQYSEPDSPEAFHYFKILTDMEGHLEEVSDLFPALQAGGGVPAETNMLLTGGKCDSAGRCYLGDASMSRVYVIDQDGSLLTVLEDSSGQGTPLSYIGKLPDGTPLYACMDFQGQRLSVYGFDGQECKELYRGEYEYLGQCLFRSNGDLLYGSGSKLLRWNVIQGTHESLYASRELNFAGCEGIVCGSDGKPYAAFRQGDGTFLYGFTDEKTETVTIHVEQMTYVGNDYLEKCAAAYTSRHPGVIIEVSAPAADRDLSDRDLQLSRLITRLSQGDGPDLMLVLQNDLSALQKNGALADLSEILTAAEWEPFFPGLQKAGQIGDGLYGLACGASFSTLIVSDQVWAGTSWTLSDILGIMQERESSGEPLEYFQAPAKYSSSSHDLYALILQNLDHSTLLDLQEGKCYFDTAEFRQALTFCKKAHEAFRDAPADQMEPEEYLLARNALVREVSGDLKQFSAAMSRLGEGYHAVGYPSADGESGHLMLTNYEDYVTVNAKTEHREIIDDFLRYLVSYEAQRQYSFSWIRTDVLKDCVKEGVTTHGYTTPVPMFFQGNSNVIVLEGKPDGSSYLPEFLEMANGSHPDNSALDAIRNMIQEETDAYFAGDKELDETVRLIQNRVQLYLDENR